MNDNIPAFPKLGYWIVAWALGVVSVGGLWLETSDVAANSGPGYIITGVAVVAFVTGLVFAALDDERHPPKKSKD